MMTDELIEEFITFSNQNLCNRHDANFPKVSIFWLNYNSISFKHIVLCSLENICKLDYPNFELIVIDNNSTDGSYETVKDFLKNINIKVKLIRLKKNVGFTGGNNVAYKMMDPDTKYFVLLNNDAIPYPDSLSKLVKVMEEDNDLAATQGIIISYRNGLVDTAGGFVDIMLRAYMAYNGLSPKLLDKSITISYADGAYSIYRVSAVKKALGYSDKIFDRLTFMYYDDTILGLKLWNKGYRIKSFPFITARHFRGSVPIFSRKTRPIYIYLGSRNWIASALSSTTRFKFLIIFLVLKSLFIRSIKYFRQPEFIVAYIKAIEDGVKIGKHKHLRKEGIDIYRTKTLYLSPKNLILGIISRRILLKKVKVN